MACFDPRRAKMNVCTLALHLRLMHESVTIFRHFSAFRISKETVVHKSRLWNQATPSKENKNL